MTGLFFSSGAQNNNEQVWLDWQVDYPTAKNLLYEVTASYQTLLNPDEKWRSVSLSPGLEYTGFRRIEFTASLPFSYTIQKAGYNTINVNAALGTRFYFSQGKRMDARLYVEYEQRYFYEIEPATWDISNRIKPKGEVYICINGPSLFRDNLWYGLMSYEEFIVIDKQLDERFANRRRARVGIGYRKNYSHRLEFAYYRQSSRNEMEGNFISDDNIIQLKYKLYLNAPKPVQTNE